MIREAAIEKRTLKQLDKTHDIVIVGGGMTGTVAALTAARESSRVALIQDRPVLGGNGSSEVRLWILGATSHMGNNNRWAREGGIVDEILMENVYKNKEGNPVIFDTILIDKILAEQNIDLYLNTSVFSVIKEGSRIAEVVGFNSQNSTLYNFKAKMFIDASGDGIVAYQSGVPFRVGAENSAEFGEGLAPDIEDYGELLGHTLFFYSKKTEEAVNYTAPDFALKDISQIPRVKNVKVGEDGCKLWWFEYGGRKDTVHDTEEIKMELWKVAYGVWDHIKNSGDYEGAENYTLEWVGLIPGKRESRRFEGHYMLKQQDVVEQVSFKDAVSFGGWAIDLHPADGVYSSKPGCNQWHSKGVFSIPYRCYVPQGIDNLYLSGRGISASHIAFGSTRVMATCGHGGQAVGMAAHLCLQGNNKPADLIDDSVLLTQLQQKLLAIGHYIPELSLDPNTLLQDVSIESSSELALQQLKPNGDTQLLDFSAAQMIPVKGTLPDFTIKVFAQEQTTLTTEIRVSSKRQNHTPDVTLKQQEHQLTKGENVITIAADQLEAESYVFYTFLKNDLVSLPSSDTRITGILTVYNKINPAVSNFGKQEAPENSGVESFEFWCPIRRPGGHNFAFSLSQPIESFGPQNITNGKLRPISAPNAWVADPEDKTPAIRLRWPKEVTINKLDLFFDNDYDHPAESVQMGHPESIMPFCVREAEIWECGERLVSTITNNAATHRTIVFDEPLKTNSILIKLKHPSPSVPAALFNISCS